MKAIMASRISQKLFYWNVMFMYWKLRMRDKIMRFLFCKRGYHKLIPQGLKHSRVHWENKKKVSKTESVNFLGCINCGCKFFVSDGYRKRYIRMTTENRSRMLNDLKGIINNKKLRKIKYESKKKIHPKEFKPKRK